ncbi:AAA family ATPase [Ruminococcaceae bacterium OttesenSCG-928-A11]|nr:AAA family ATPase [Ruminococcaceae bacterium OttesenSCG-928-A11]
MLQAAREQLQAFIIKSGKSQKQVAKEIGISSAVISQFLSGIYAGNNEDVADKVLRYLEVGESRLMRIEVPTFCAELRNAKQVLFAATYAHQNNEISLVYGDAGAGKTTALKHYAENNPGVIFITANACSRSPRAILHLVTEAVGKIPAGNQFIMMRNLVEALSGSNRLLIIDEADHLTPNALQAIRNLNDEAGIGIVLSGNDRIKHQMYGRGSLQFDQLRTRLSCKKKVTNKYLLDEIRQLFPNADADCLKHLHHVACKESLRTAIKRYTFAAQCAAMKGQALDMNFLRQGEIVQLEAE